MSRMVKPLTSALVRHKIRQVASPLDGEVYAINRNPRNLEKLRIGYKPSGYHLEKPGRSYWHKLEIVPSGRYLNAEVQHYENGPVITASTSEWSIKKQLYKTNDTSAYVNLARVLARRCMQAGITEMLCNLQPQPDSKADKFVRTLQENGIAITEPERIMPPRSWDVTREEKPWEVNDE